MNFQTNNTKKISYLLIVSIIFLNLSFLSIPNDAKADLSLGLTAEINAIPLTVSQGIYFGTGGISVPGVSAISVDPVLNGQIAEKNLWDGILEYTKQAGILLLKQAARTFINEITTDTVNWIGGLGDASNTPPSYVTNFGSFMADVGDKAVGSYIANDPNLNALCTPFRLQIQVALGLSAGYGPGHLFDGQNCSLTQVATNIKNAANSTIDSFTNTGGWDSWLSITTNPQNNVQGAYLLLQSDMGTKVLAAKEAKTIDLQNGQGALSFKSCYNTYQTRAGNQVGPDKSPDYIDGTPPPAPPADMGPPDGYRTQQHCTMKTPGTIVTSMLDQSVRSNQNMTEMVAALSDGIDAVLGALMDRLLTLATTQLYQGVFDTDTAAARSNYGNYIDGSYSIALDALNTQSASNTGQTIVLDNLIHLPATGTNPIINSQQVPVGPHGYYDYASGDTSLARAKNQQIASLNSAVQEELAYQNTYKTAKNILTEARKVFATSSECSAKSSAISSSLRVLLIRSDILSNIDGTPDSNRGIATIDFNLIAINNALSSSSKNMTILDNTALSVLSATSVDAVIKVSTLFNSTSFNTDPKTDLITKIKGWLGRVAANYNSDPYCPIDITKVLLINSPAKASY